MNGLTNTMHTLVRSIVIAAGIAVLALSAIQRAEAEQNQGFDPAEAATFQKAMCEAAGGEAAVFTYRTVEGGLRKTTVVCEGGLLDGMICDNYSQGFTSCTYPEGGGGVDPGYDVAGELIHPEEPPAVEPTGGIEPAPAPLVPTIEIADDVVAPVGDAEEPVVEETVDDGVEDDGQDLPANPVLQDTTAPTEGDPAADPNVGAGGGMDSEQQIIASGSGIQLYELDEDDQI